MPPIYADSFGQLGQSIAQEDYRRRAALQDAINGLVSDQERRNELSRRNAISDRDWAYKVAMDADNSARQSKLDALNERYYNFLMASQQQKHPASVVNDAIRRAQELVVGGNPVPQELEAILGKDVVTAKNAEAMANRPAVERDYIRSLDLANTENLRRQAMVDLERVRKGGNSPRSKWWRAIDWFGQYNDYPSDYINQAQERLDSINSRYPMPSRDMLDAYTEPGVRGRLNPSAELYPWLKEKLYPESPTAGVGSPVFQPARGNILDSISGFTGGSYAAPSTSRMPPAFYQEVNRLISLGVNPAESKRRVMAQFLR